jgi:hypothetical protein
MPVIYTIEYTCLFDSDADREAFVHDPGWQVSLDIDCATPGTDDVDHWSVTIRGPWTEPEEGEAVIRPLAEKHHGAYDGWDSFVSTPWREGSRDG